MYGVAKPDGLTLGAVNPALYFDQLVGRIRSEIRLGKIQLDRLAGKKRRRLLHARRHPFQDHRRSAQRQGTAKCGSTGTGSTGHYIPRLLEETLGIKTQIVSGYPGAPDIELAIERGEVFCWSPLLATYFGREPYRRWHKSGYVRVLMQTGAKRDPRLKDTPTLNELMQQYKTSEAGHRLAKVILTAATLGRPIGAAPGTPADRVKILRDAYAKALADPELLADAAKQGWEVDPTKGEELQKLSKEVITQPREIIERMKWVLGGNKKCQTRSRVQRFKRSKLLGLFSILTLELLNPLNLEPIFAQANFYQGKTLKVIVGSAPGGGYDQWARLMAQHIGKHTSRPPDGRSCKICRARAA